MTLKIPTKLASQWLGQSIIMITVLVMVLQLIIACLRFGLIFDTI